jgi:hypothetical protein
MKVTLTKELLVDSGQVEKAQDGMALVKVGIWKVFNPVYLRLKELD